MASNNKNQSLILAAGSFIILIYHSVVRDVRTKSGSTVFGIFQAVTQIGTFFLIFYMMYTIMGRSVAIRGDFFLFLLSGIFLLVTHMGAMSSVLQASNAISPIMQHAPMSVILAILSNALAQLYLQIVAITLIISVVYVLGNGFTVYNPRGVLLPYFLSWASGISIGLVFMLLKPIAPGIFDPLSKVYLRAQMITSGKFMPAAYLPASMVSWFDWNPLFHAIDQMRLAVFINYSREVSSMSYPIYFTIVCVVIGLMGEFWLRKNLSKSKHAGR